MRSIWQRIWWWATNRHTLRSQPTSSFWIFWIKIPKSIQYQNCWRTWLAVRRVLQMPTGNSWLVTTSMSYSQSLLVRLSTTLWRFLEKRLGIASCLNWQTEPSKYWFLLWRKREPWTHQESYCRHVPKICWALGLSRKFQNIWRGQKRTSWLEKRLGCQTTSTNWFSSISARL